jgi:DNA-binding transcriptional LysR family regulator
MDFHKLQVFGKVFEYRSFSRAAEAILLSQPTVSGHIKSLEEDLGITLFDRMGREVMPTRAAELLYGHVTSIMKRVDQASAAMDAFTSRFRGDLNLGGSTIPGQYVLPGLMSRFKSQYPEVKLNLSISGTKRITDQVLSGKLDMGVVGAESGDDRLEIEPLKGDQVGLVAKPDHPLAGSEIEPTELIMHPLLIREAGSGTLMFVLSCLKKAGAKVDKLQIAAQLGSNMAVLQGVKAGLGLGFVSQRVFSADLEAKKVAVVRLKGLNFKRDFYMINRKERTHSPAAKVFMDFCRDKLGVNK